jgi:hypothetical protein
MANFAEIDENNIVLRVLVVDNSEEGHGDDYLANQLGLGGTWIQTSYNSRFRGVFAGIGFTYSYEEDIFIVPQPYPSWTREGSYWYAPIPYPTDGKRYVWNEEFLRWDLASGQTPSE